MDVDPLSDTVPPRYAIESDEEEDELNPLNKHSPPPPTVYDINIAGDLPKSQPLVIGTGDAGKLWAKGAALGEQTGAVYVNKVQIGLAFNPPWTSATVLISEALAKLPLSAMHPYASAILDSLTPKSLAILDSYPTPTYASAERIPYHDAPIRYLTTSETLSFPPSEAQPFAPPNLISSTSAAFLTSSSPSSSPTNPRTLILLPSPHIPPSPPRTLSPSNFSQLEQDAVEWPAPLLSTAQGLLFRSVGTDEGAAHAWEAPLSTEQKEKVPKRNTEVGEGGMYI